MKLLSLILVITVVASCSAASIRGAKKVAPKTASDIPMGFSEPDYSDSVNSNKKVFFQDSASAQSASATVASPRAKDPSMAGMIAPKMVDSHSQSTGKMVKPVVEPSASFLQRQAQIQAANAMRFQQMQHWGATYQHPMAPPPLRMYGYTNGYGYMNGALGHYHYGSAPGFMQMGNNVMPSGYSNTVGGTASVAGAVGGAMADDMYAGNYYVQPVSARANFLASNSLPVQYYSDGTPYPSDMRKYEHFRVSALAGEAGK